MNKRGQVTTFVLIGILVVVLSIGIFFLRDRIFSGVLEPKDIQVPEQAESVKIFVQGCIDNTLENAVDLIGRQGGYIELPGDPVNVGQFTNHLTMFGDSKVVYWYYKADNNVDYIQVPSIPSMELEISNYVENNLMGCLGGFNEYDGFVVKKGRIGVETDISNSVVVSKVIFPLEINKGNFDFKFPGFYGVRDVPLGDLYTVAKRIHDRQEEDLFFEKKTLDIMGFYEEIPLVGETSDCVAPIWVTENVKNDFRGILSSNIPFFRVEGTNVDLDENKKFYNLEAGIQDESVDVNFLFSSAWPFEMEIFPSDNGLLKGKSVTEALGRARGIAESFVCLSTYEFLYNVKYPVLTILNKDDFTFQFANMVVVDKNKPRVNNDDFLTFQGYDQRFCQGQTDFIVDTIDFRFNNLDEVDVSYKCINHMCSLGRSERGVWRGRVPLCINGAFIGEKEGYHLGKSEISTNEEGSALVVLKKFKTLDVEALVNRAGSGELREGEKVHIQLDEEEKEYSAFVLYPDQKRINLIPGNYKVNLLLITPGEYRIDEKEFTHCFDVPKSGVLGILGSTEERCETIKIPGTTVDQLVTGSQEFEFFISENDLLNRKIIFHLPYHGEIHDVTELAGLTDQPTVLPEFR